MGGINHQPCNKKGTEYLKFSTMMSRTLSSARSELEQANICLEDVLLAELAGAKSGSVTEIVEHLNNSRMALAEALKVIFSLYADMQKHKFEDLPVLKTTDLDLLGRSLSGTGVVETVTWNAVSTIMRDEGFYGVLSNFEFDVRFLDAFTKMLVLEISSCKNAAATGTLNLVLEENRTGNFKVAFARLYTAWLEFQQSFLASSMLSTELWYRHQKVGSLLEKVQNARAA